MKSVIALFAIWLIAAPHAQSADRVAGNPSAAAAGASDDYASRARELVLEALALVGIHYHYGGDSPETGFDCSGLVDHVFSQAAGLMLPRDSRAISRIGEKIPRDELEPGDLVFFNTRQRPFSHVGIYLGAHRFIHAPSRGGRVEIMTMTSRYWRSRYDGARRIELP